MTTLPLTSSAATSPLTAVDPVGIGSGVSRTRRAVLVAAAASVGACAYRPPGGHGTIVGGSSTDEGAPASSFADWRPRTFPGKRPTRYRVEADGGRWVLRADARASASMLRRPVQVDPADLGELRFSWRVPAPLHAADLRDRDAEDAPVRLVLAFDGDVSRLTSRDRMLFELARTLTGEAPPYATLMYVWDHRAEPGTVVSSNSTGRIRKLVVDGADSPHGPWRHHVRDIAADFRRAFDEAPGRLVGLGVMTDTDNTRAEARAWYGPVTMQARDGRPLLP
jgi:hypothetical protein